MSSYSKSNRRKAVKNPVVSLPPAGKRLEAAAESFLLEDIVIDILSRLPSKDVFRCQCVCRKWRDLISSEDFVNLHIQSGLRCTDPMVLVEQRRKYGEDQMFLDKWWMPVQKKPMFHRFASYGYPDCCTEVSQEGFLVLKSQSSKEIIICNPVRREKVRIIVPKKILWSTNVYGMFFNQTLKQYCLLFGVHQMESRSFEYKILNLGPKPCTRQILNPWNHKYRIPHTSPLVVNEHLYWLVSTGDGNRFSGHADIMEFDPKTEGFTLLHYPVQKSVEYDDFGLNLVNIDGFLSVVRISRVHMVARVDVMVDVIVWTLKDRAKESWTISNYCFSWEFYPRNARPKTVACKDEELVIQCSQVLLGCNLRTGIVRNLGKKRYNLYVSFFSHIISLASLRNCKSKICMEGEDEEPELCGLS